MKGCPHFLSRKKCVKPVNDDWELSLGMHWFRAFERGHHPTIEDATVSGQMAEKPQIVNKTRGRLSRKVLFRCLPLCNPGDRARRRRVGWRKTSRHGVDGKVLLRQSNSLSPREVRRRKHFNIKVVWRIRNNVSQYACFPKGYRAWSEKRRISYTVSFFKKHRKASMMLLFGGPFARHVLSNSSGNRWGSIKKTVQRRLNRSEKRTLVKKGRLIKTESSRTSLKKLELTRSYAASSDLSPSRRSEEVVKPVSPSIQRKRDQMARLAARRAGLVESVPNSPAPPSRSSTPGYLRHVSTPEYDSDRFDYDSSSSRS